MSAKVTQDRKHERRNSRGGSQLRGKSSGHGGRGKDAAEMKVDRYVGARIRERRTLMGVTQMMLAENLGLTFQQVQKYERGANRVSAGKLFRIAEVLEVPVSFFFDGVEHGEKASDHAVDPDLTRESLTVAHDFAGIGNDEVRKSLAKMVKALNKVVNERTAV